MLLVTSLYSVMQFTTKIAQMFFFFQQRVVKIVFRNKLFITFWAVVKKSKATFSTNYISISHWPRIWLNWLKLCLFDSRHNVLILLSIRTFSIIKCWDFFSCVSSFTVKVQLPKCQLEGEMKLLDSIYGLPFLEKCHVLHCTSISHT